MLRSKIKSAFKNWIVREPKRIGKLRHLVQNLSPNDTILLEYAVKSEPRWSVSSPHPQLYRILDAGRPNYRAMLNSFLEMSAAFIEIKRLKSEVDDRNPSWINGWMPALDGVAIYGHIARYKPETYLEVGSGNSTKFACMAIRNLGLPTRVVSIDPHPRAEIDKLCDSVIRKPLEAADLDVFSQLKRNDVVYIDNSHRSFMNSDVTVFFLEVLPLLAEGVIVGVHDIFLPFDYPPDWSNRWYSEQYLLACYILAGWNRMNVTFPSAFISEDPELKSILAPLWTQPAMAGVETHGCSFWFQMKS